MRRRSLIWKIAPAYLVVIGLSTVGVAWYAGDAARSFYKEHIGDELQAKAQLGATQIGPAVTDRPAAAIDQMADRFSQTSGVRVTVIAPDGVVIGESHHPTQTIERHDSRPEVIAALTGSVGRAIRLSRTLGKQMMYVAVPIKREGEVIGVLRTAIELSELRAALRAVYTRIAVGGLVAAGLAGGLTLFVFAQQIASPLRRLRRGAMRFASGNLERPLPVPESLEIGELAESLNSMARQLNATIQTINHQAQEREAVLASMVEGVIAVDADRRVINMNLAAARFLHVEVADAHGRAIEQIIRNSTIQQLVEELLFSEKPIRRDVTLRQTLADKNDQPDDRFFQIQGTMLRGTRGDRLGALIVMHDVTQLRRLEQVRRDFVANVSHELKTPVTAIKGFVETLLESDDEADMEDVRRFVGIIGRQAERLHLIVEDLLTLARVEQGAERYRLPLETYPLEAAFATAVEICQVSAEARQMEIDVSCPADLQVRINPPLFEQAVVNLLDNAVKYSPPGSLVRLTGAAGDGQVIIAVADNGPGIEAKHLPRLFERFYRTDKARSRAMGGTGLGLAIVKHVVQLHGGRVDVASTPGKGSVFTIHLPMYRETTDGDNPQSRPRAPRRSPEAA